MATLFDRGAKTAPSHYPRVPFHLLRFFQLLSSIIVGGIMAYFTYYLNHDSRKEPWTFIFLFAASLASIAVLTFTIFLHCFTGLNPRLNIALNSLLAVLWALGWSLLTWYMSGTLTNMCDAEHWNEDIGIMVCRIYKALFTFTLLGMLSTFAALGLDVYVRRRQTSRGIYQLHDLDSKSRASAPQGGYNDGSQRYGAGGLAAPRESNEWEEPRRSMGPYEEQSDRLVRGEGYNAIHNDDEDTGYRGAHSRQASGI